VPNKFTCVRLQKYPNLVIKKQFIFIKLWKIKS